MSRETFTRWLSDGESWIGVFENHDLGHYDIGRRVAFCFDNTDEAKAEVGETQAPGHKAIGLGWRYILVAICHTVEEAEAAMRCGVEEEP